MSRLESYFSMAVNLGLIIGLGLVFVELRQNNEAILIDRELTLAELHSQNQMAIAGDAELATLIGRAWRGEELEFSTGEEARLRAYVGAHLEPLISYYFMRDSDFLDTQDWCSSMRFYVQMYEHAKFSSIVAAYTTYSHEIRQEIDNRCTPADA